jgi:hypothetical protein
MRFIYDKRNQCGVTKANRGRFQVGLIDPNWAFRHIKDSKTQFVRTIVIMFPYLGILTEYDARMN